MSGAVIIIAHKGYCSRQWRTYEQLQKQASKT